jgi:hypothetical protein
MSLIPAKRLEIAGIGQNECKELIAAYARGTENRT